MKHYDDIQLLRGLAVVLVVIHHSNDNLYKFGGNFFRYFNGSTGVDLFFVISGFVIALSIRPLLAAARSGESDWPAIWAFWTRRAFRLLPSAWFWLLAILAFQIFYNSSGVFGSLHANLMATLFGILQIANIRFAESFMNYEYGVSFYYWSLSLEEQFYLLLPLVAIMSRRFFPWVLLGIAIFQLAQPRSIYDMAFRTDALCLGVLLAFATMRLAHRGSDAPSNGLQKLAGTMIAFSALVLLVTANAKAIKLSPLPMSIVTLSALTLVFIASLDRGHVRRLMIWPALFRWLGERSYAIYLIHVPSFYFARETLHRLDYPDPGAIPLLLCSVMFMIVTSDLNYRYLELPLRNKGRKLAASISAGPYKLNTAGSQGL